MVLGADQVITASWDRLAMLHDVETGSLLIQLSGELQLNVFFLQNSINIFEVFSFTRSCPFQRKFDMHCDKTVICVIRLQFQVLLSNVDDSKVLLLFRFSDKYKLCDSICYNK